VGVFLNPVEMKSKAIVPALKIMENEDLDDVYIVPAERLIAEGCNLNLNTEGHPWTWAGRFDDAQQGPRLLARYLDDYRLAAIQVVNRLAANPTGVGSSSVKSASASYTAGLIPPTARALMARWSAPRRLYRT
jgi:hypothetical protein